MKGELAKLKSPVLAFRLSSNGRPGYFERPPHEGAWHISNGEGIIPWKRPKPARTTTLWDVPRSYASPRRGSTFLYCVFSTPEGQVSNSQRNPAFRVSCREARHLSWR